VAVLQARQSITTFLLSFFSANLVNKKIIGGITGSIVVVAIIGIAIASLNFEPEVTPSIQTQNEKLGLVINTPTSAITVEKLISIYDEAGETGIGRSNVYVFWNTIEPEKGQYNWDQTDVLMSLNRENNLKVTLYFSIINGETLGPFPDWIGKPSIRSIPEDRLVKVLDQILTRYHIIDAVIIGGDTELQFRYKENEINIPLYEKLFNEVYGQLKEKHPNVKIGNSFSLHGTINKNLEHIVLELDVGDFIAFSYFPVDNLNEITKTPQEARDDLEKILELSPNKPIAIFETSWSTSDFVGGNEKDQVEFLSIVYDFYRENESQIEFFTWYRQYDKPEGTCTIAETNSESGVAISGGNEFVVERMNNYICSAGLIDSNGNAKPGWNEFQEQIRQSSM